MPESWNGFDRETQRLIGEIHADVRQTRDGLVRLEGRVEAACTKVTEQGIVQVDHGRRIDKLEKVLWKVVAAVVAGGVGAVGGAELLKGLL